MKELQKEKNNCLMFACVLLLCSRYLQRQLFFSFCNSFIRFRYQVLKKFPYSWISSSFFSCLALAKSSSASQILFSRSVILLVHQQEVFETQIRDYGLLHLLPFYLHQLSELFDSEDFHLVAELHINHCITHLIDIKSRC